MDQAVRLPLCEPSAATRESVTKALAGLHLLAPPTRLRSLARAVSLAY